MIKKQLTTLLFLLTLTSQQSKSMDRPEGSLTRVPHDVIAYHIMPQTLLIDPQSFSALAATCKEYYNLSNDDTIYHIAQRTYHNTINPSEHTQCFFTLLQYAAHHNNIAHFDNIIAYATNDEQKSLHILCNALEIEMSDSTEKNKKAVFKLFKRIRLPKVKSSEIVFFQIPYHLLRNFNRVSQKHSLYLYCTHIINTQDNNGNTPLHDAILNNRLELAELLCRCGADVNITDKDGYTPLHIAISNNRPELIIWLCQHGADVNIKNKNGYTPLLFAAIHNNPELTQFLYRYGADVNITDKDGYTPLHLAAIHNNPELAQLLYRYGADLNAQNNDGYTPLHLATDRTYKKLVQWLCQHGAAINIKNNDGHTPLQLAQWNKSLQLAQYKYAEIIKILESYEAELNHYHRNSDGCIIL